MKIILSANDIDLSRHAVIEASAGTGKTHTLENLVARLVSEEKVPLEEILVVTFTEKAAGELKDRIRKKLGSALKTTSDEEDRQRLENAINRYDSAAIYTIHGFCQQVLQQYAFENRQAFAHELVDSNALYQIILRKLMRSWMPVEFGKYFEDLLTVTPFYTDNSLGSHLPVLAGKLHASPDARLLPHIEEEFSLDDLIKQIEACLDDLLTLAGTINPNTLPQSDLYCQYVRLNLRINSRDTRLKKIVLPLLELLNQYNNKQHSIKSIYQFLEIATACSGYNEHGFQVLSEGWLKSGDNSPAVCPNLSKIIAKLNCLNAHWEIIRHFLPIKTLRQMNEAADDYKKQNALMSYDDMLLWVNKAVQHDDYLANALRKRFRYALVDEFQDTDSVQWNIFKTLFTGDDEHRLILIGDPKQAIYAFRGADVFTYLEAKEYLIEQKKAVAYCMDVNWRSLPGLIDALNKLFLESKWFSTDGSITYLRVRAPEKIARKTRLYQDDTHRAPLTVVCFDENHKASSLQQALANFIAEEIAHLLGMDQENGKCEPRMMISSPRGARLLQANDICILVYKERDSWRIEKALRERKIPFSYYKKTGLFQSDEAIEICYLLGALADPEDPEKLKKALLTRIFAIPLDQLNQFDCLTPTHPVRRLFAPWCELAENREWAMLFQSIVEDSGMLFRNDDGKVPESESEYDADWERRKTNYEHIVQVLLTEAFKGQRDIADLWQWLNNLRSRSISIDAETEIHRLETEQPKVQIMTIHKAKGLQYPVVFIGGGFSGFQKPAYASYHDDHGRIVYDLGKDHDGMERWQNEHKDEQRRVFYVALTRAMHKLYVPRFISQKMTRSTEAPMQWLVSDSLVQVWANRCGDSHTRHIDEKRKVIDQAEGAIASDVESPEGDRNQLTGFREIYLVPEPLFPEKSFRFWHRKTHLESFSSLHCHRHRFSSGMGSSDEEAIDGERRMIADEETGEAVFVPGVQNIILPPGSRTGSLLHSILERADYSEVAAAENWNVLLQTGSSLHALILKQMEYYGFALESKKEALVREIIRVVCTVLQTPLQNGEGAFRLCDLSSDDRIHELDFFASIQAKHSSLSPVAIERLGFKKDEEGFIHGIIDLVFRYSPASSGHPRYYILDWKSNLLEGGYAGENLEECMTQNDYHLQYLLYGMALIQWLRQTLKDFDYQRDFGGVYYLFLRGMNGENSRQGVYFTRPESLECLLKPLSQL